MHGHTIHCTITSLGACAPIELATSLFILVMALGAFVVVAGLILHAVKG